MTRPACSGCGNIPPPSARECPVCARPLPPPPSATVEAARGAADLRRQHASAEFDDLLRSYDPRPVRPALQVSRASAGTAALGAASPDLGAASARAPAPRTPYRAPLTETVSPGADAVLAEGWRAVIRMDQQLFPSWIVSTAAAHPGSFARLEAACQGLELLGDAEGLIGAYVACPRDGAHVRVTVEVGDIARSSAFECALPRAGAAYAIFPKIKYDYEALLEARQQRPVDVTVRVELDGVHAGEATETCTLRSVNECPFYLELHGKSGPQPLDVGFMFAAYVNENHPWIEGLLKEALQTGIVKSFMVSPNTPADEVVAQVYAVWSVLRRRAVKYSNITTTPRPSERIACQHVRFVDDSITNAQANCVDGSVLLASVLRKIGVEPYLVKVPGHMYLAFSIAEIEQPVGDGVARLTHLFGLETTMVGEAELAPTSSWAAQSRSCTVMRPLPWLGIRLDGPRYEFALTGPGVSQSGVAQHAALDADDWLNFSAALEFGTRNLGSGYAELGARTPREIQILRVTDARRVGLMPLAFRPTAGATPPAQQNSN